MDTKFHLSLDVASLTESVRFYSTLLDAPPTKLKPDYAKFDLEYPLINLAMQEKSHCCLQGLNHMGLRVGSFAEVQTVKQRLAQAGYSTQDEHNTTCCYALQDKFWVSDPTGYRWEVYVLKADTEVESVQTGKPEEKQSCCKA